MFKELVNSLKIKIQFKDVLLWFAISFMMVSAVFIVIYKRSIDSSFLLEMVGYAVVFVLMMTGTKSYSHFIELYQNSHHRGKRI